MAAFLLKKDYLDWYNGKGYRGAGFIHIKNYFSIGAEFNQISQSSMKTVLENDIEHYIKEYAESATVDPDDDDFINAVAKALYNMARSYVGV